MKWLKIFWDRSFTDWRYRVAMHVGFWFFLLFFWMQESVVIHIRWQQHFSVTLVGLCFILFLFYPLVYIIVPLLRQRKWLLALGVFILYYIVAILLRGYNIELIVNWYNLKQTWVVGNDFWRRIHNQLNIFKISAIIFSSMASFVEIIYIPLTIKFIRYAYRFNLKQAWLAQQNAQLQLTTLRAQINPHFFFNTLNNLQSFIVQNEKDKSVALLNKLADFMRSSLYDCGEEWITMQQETELLTNYMAIERVRFDEQEAIAVNLLNNDPNYKLPPFIILPFIENAFKYGGSLPAGEIAIDIKLENEPGKLVLTAVNKYYPANTTLNQGGIGLQNVRQRLDHYFNDRYNLAIDDTDNYYRVKLEISKA